MSFLELLWEKVKAENSSETITACDLKVGRCRQLIEIMNGGGLIRGWSRGGDG